VETLLSHGLLDCSSFKAIEEGNSAKFQSPKKAP